nr:hypothetical protein [Catenulispora pinisilvae]
MTSDIETLITALHVKIDNEYGGVKRFGRPPKLSASELLCLAPDRDHTANIMTATS